MHFLSFSCALLLFLKHKIAQAAELGVGHQVGSFYLAGPILFLYGFPLNKLMLILGAEFYGNFSLNQVIEHWLVILGSEQ